jgi:hypothetical protein
VRKLTPAVIFDLQHRAVVSGQQIRIDGARGACLDCDAYLDVVIEPTGKVDAKVFHSDGCPWYRQNAGGGW